MRYPSKRELLGSIRREHDTLEEVLAQVPRSRYGEAGVWGDGWTVVDLVAHLAEWHAMFLRWYGDGLAGREPVMPAPGFKWNETPALNRSIWEKHRGRSFEAAWEEFSRSYVEIVELVEGLPEDALLEPGHFSWTRKNALVAYLGPNTASHYRFATKVLRRWMKKGARDHLRIEG